MVKSFTIRHCALFILIVFPMLSANAQSSIVYSYDNNGNRISRVLSVLKSASIDFPAEEKDIKVQNEKDIKGQEEFKEAESAIKIYPNPTSGIIKISLENYTDPINGKYQVYDLKGTVLKESRFESALTEINMSDISHGIYVLRIIINGNRSDYKVIKQN